MSLHHELSERAERDIAAARDWYEQQQEGLGRRFIDAVTTAIEFAATYPRACPEWRRGVRTVRCQKFPYRVYFDAGKTAIAVLAVYHCARRPDRWNDPNRE